MQRIALVLIVAVVALLVLAQLVLPPLAENRVEGRLTRDGGSARVELSAFPAVRLLAGHGDSLHATGSGLSFGLERRENALERLDGFGEVRVRLERVQAGPLEVSRLDLDRGEDESAYRLRAEATTTPRDVARFLVGVLGDLATWQLPGGGLTKVPLGLDATVRSDGGNVRVISASGSVAGIPAGPLAELVVAEVARRL